MNKICILCLICALCTCCASQPVSVETAPGTASSSDDVPGIEEKSELHSAESMLMPADAKKTASGYAYAVIKKGTEKMPVHADTVEVHLCARNLDGTVIQEDTRMLSIAHSTPFFEEILPLMHVGETMRIWGDQTVVWEIEMIGINEAFRAPEDYAAPPETAVLLDGFSDVHYRAVEAGTGDVVRPGQALRVHISRWDSDGAVIESSRAGRGMLLFLNEALKQTDPVHYAMITKMREGGHVRIWIPAERISSVPKIDIVEDIWLAEFLTQLDPPEQLACPEKAEGIEDVVPGAGIRFISRAENAVPLADAQNVEVDMTCWKSDSGELVDASYLRDGRDVMVLTTKIGVWLDIMKKAAPGDVFETWIQSKVLPESVGMDLTCRVHVYDVVRDNAASETSGAAPASGGSASE